MLSFAAIEFPLLGCIIVGKHGVNPDAEKIKFTDQPVPVDVKRLRNFLGLAAFLHKYSCNYAEMTVYFSRLLKKDEK